MNNPKPEHRISFLEKQFLALGSNIEGLQEDIESLEAHVDLGFNQAHTFIKENIATKEDLSQLESRIDAKMSAMETRIIDTMTRLMQQKPSE